jgi:hypothetical protein
MVPEISLLGHQTVPSSGRTTTHVAQKPEAASVVTMAR